MVTHEIAGLLFRTRADAVLPRFLDAPFDRFIVRYGAPDIHQNFHRIQSDLKALVPLSKKEREHLSSLYRFSGGSLKNPILCTPEVRERLMGPAFRGNHTEIWLDKHCLLIRDFSCSQIEIYYTPEFGGYLPEHGGYSPEYHIVANFKEIFASFLPSFSAMLIHSSGVIRRGKAAVFLAPDEGGKTTVVRHSNGHEILSGDQIILRREGNVLFAHGTPLGGLTSGPCRARVGGIFVLEKAGHFGLEPIIPAELLQCLWTEHRKVTAFLPRHMKIRAFELMSDICYQIPLFKMCFQKEYVDWDVIEAVMEEGIDCAA